LTAPGSDERVAERIGDEIAAELAGGPKVRTSATAWRSGEVGADVVARAARALRREPAAA